MVHGKMPFRPAPIHARQASQLRISDGEMGRFAEDAKKAVIAGWLEPATELDPPTSVEPQPFSRKADRNLAIDRASRGNPKNRNTLI
jgi:hypothetical protein